MAASMSLVILNLEVELKANLAENSAALMTSDRGTSGGAELELTSPVTPKTAGLNPNASVFLSNKSSTSTDSSSWDGVNANEYQYTNGDVSRSDQGGGPTPSESPLPAEESSAFVESQAVPVFSSENNTQDGDSPLSLENMDEDHLRQLIKSQLEVCFSRDSLASDSYLQSQMDADQYVPITTVANLQQIQRLSTDVQLIVQLLRESPNVQVDEKGEKVRPNHNRCIVILREIPESTPIEDVHLLFSGENCPKFVSCEFAHNNNWYVTFDSDADAQRAYQYLREDVKTFLGKPIMARIKAKPLIRMTYPRNGYRQYQQQQQQVAAQQQQQQAQPQIQPAQIPQSEPQAAPAQQQFPIQQQVPLMPNVPYMNGQQQISFFTPNPLMQQWPTSPTLLDPSMVLHINGYHATSVKMNPNPSRHQYSNVNRNNRTTRLNRPNNHDRINAENRQSYDRLSVTSHRTSPRNQDNSAQISPSPYRNRGENSTANHSHVQSTVSQPTQAPLDNNSNTTISSRQSESMPPAQRGYRSRRRTDHEGGPRSMRQNSGIPQGGAAKEKPVVEQKFDLEINSFPPLPGPGPTSASTTSEKFESKLSDVVKGTAKPHVKEPAKPQSSQTSQTPVVSTATTATTTVAPPVIPARPVTPPQQQKETSSCSSSNSNSALNGIAVVLSSGGTSTSSSCTPTRVPSPPVSPQKPTKVSIPESTQKPVESNVTLPKPQLPVNHQVKSQPVDKASPVKLSYAQMVQKGRETNNDSTADSKPSSDSEQESVSQNDTRATLKEQPQAKQPSTAKTPSKDQGGSRKDFEQPKDQRHFSGRRAKENRERRDRRRGEREGLKSSTK